MNYCANLWALKELGVTNVIATTACGSLREEIEPGHLVVLSDYIDMTKSRKHYSHYNNAIETGGPRGQGKNNLSKFNSKALGRDSLTSGNYVIVQRCQFFIIEGVSLKFQIPTALGLK